MCTVTFIPTSSGAIITSNRDEKYSRLPATPPQPFVNGRHTLLCPRDGNAGGTWMAVRNDGLVAVLLNGAMEAHAPSLKYRLSRGLLLLNMLRFTNMVAQFTMEMCQGIEPFTLIVYDGKCLYECIWDERQANVSIMNNDQKHIWSSVTLYDKAAIVKRRQWFNEWQVGHQDPKQADVLKFHLTASESDAGNSLLMNRPGLTKTVSVTSVLARADNMCMTYFDVAKQQLFEQTLKITAAEKIHF